ncbi:hypothetical protein D9613_004047 [Agrocybe pediades]|uniref:Uncharacterized protein n=1 Tax=Agrocybe pediades TaxID=84607 RepID=A0A8H4QJ21_9AGAR|nr:hypothetical protein D9613_004047 [Agrocybe pediades]
MAFLLALAELEREHVALAIKTKEVEIEKARLAALEKETELATAKARSYEALVQLQQNNPELIEKEIENTQREDMDSIVQSRTNNSAGPAANATRVVDNVAQAGTNNYSSQPTNDTRNPFVDDVVQAGTSNYFGQPTNDTWNMVPAGTNNFATWNSSGLAGPSTSTAAHDTNSYLPYKGSSNGWGYQGAGVDYGLGGANDWRQ